MADEDIREGDPDRPRRKAPRDDRDDDDYDDRPRRRRRRDEDDDKPEDAALGAVVPLGVSVWALVSLYSALLSCVIPGLGLVAVVCGVLAFMTHKQKGTYGSVTGNIRAVIGIVIGLFTLLGNLVLLVALLSGK